MLIECRRRRSGRSWAFVQYAACILHNDPTAHVHVVVAHGSDGSRFHARLCRLLDDTILVDYLARVEISDRFECTRHPFAPTYVVAEVSHLSCLNHVQFDYFKQVRVFAYRDVYVDCIALQYPPATPIAVLRAAPKFIQEFPPLPLSPAALAVESLAEMYSTLNAETYIVTRADTDGFMQALREHPLASSMLEHVLTMTENIGGLCQFGLHPPLPHSIALAARLGADKWLPKVEMEHVMSDMQLLYEYTTRIGRVDSCWLDAAVRYAIAANDPAFARAVYTLYPDAYTDEQAAYARALHRHAILDDMRHRNALVM